MNNFPKIPVPLINTLKLVGFIAASIVALYLLILAIEYTLPFVIALILAAAIEPFTRWLSKKRKITISRSLAALVGTILVVTVVSFLIFVLGNLLVTQARELIIMVSEWYPDLAQSILDFIAYLEQSMDLLPNEAMQGIESMLSEMGNFVTGFVSNAALYLYHYAVSLPEIMLFIILTILAIYFISRDLLKIQKGIDKQFPPSWINRYGILQRDMLAALFGLIRATLIFMAVTFAQLFIGLYILQVKYALLTSFIITIFDALPIIGAGLFLIPWSIYALITGNIKLAIGLIILHVLISVVRQAIQPQVLGDQIGIHPLLTMITMYAGFKLFGAIGLITGPVFYVILKSILSYYTRGRSLREIIFEE